MTKLLKALTHFVVASVLLAAPAAAQESPSRAEPASDQTSNLARQASVVSRRASIGSSSVPVEIGGLPLEIGSPKESLVRPDTTLGLPASNALLRGLDEPRVLRLPTLPEDGDLPNEPQEASANVDAWGVAPNAVLATTEVILSNILANVVNEYILKGNISQINPDSWYHNLRQGFSWDDNHFSTNFFAHPYQGSVYFNAARSNGFNYWESLPFTALGSFTWECCGETHLMSLNDFANTTIGGAAIGEIFYRLSSTILDNEATGSERAWRETGAFLLNPGRGGTRLMTGRAFEQAPNPTDPLDYRGNRIATTFDFGLRMVGEGDKLDFDEDEAHGFIKMNLSFGNPWDLQRNKPFDFFTFGVQLNFREKKGLGILEARGNLHSFGLSQSESHQSLLTIAHYFDYVDNNAFEFGGQSVGFIWLNNWVRSPRTRIVAAADIHGMFMGGVNTEYAEFAEIPGVRERDREYDFGSGLGSWLQFQVTRDEYQIFELSYRVNWLHTLNGTNVGGQDTDHVIQQAIVRLGWPVGNSWGVAAEAGVFLRDSYFEEVEFENVRQRNPGLKIFGSWTVGSRGGI